jgi:orotate phosphoribosyltransferase
MPQGDRIAEFLLAIEAVKLSPTNPFTWTSGIKAPIYCDNRMIYSHPDARNVVVGAFISRIQSLPTPPHVIAGTATAAIGWAALVADRLNLPFVYVRSKAKEHGTKKRVEGDLPPGKQVVVVEDLISTGGSSMATIEALRDEGKANVTDIVTIFTYELLASLEAAGAHNVTLHPLCTLTTLIQVALDQGRISHQEAVALRAFAKDPERWQQ